MNRVAAARELTEAMAVAIQHDNVRGAAGCVESCGYLAAASGNYPDTARFLGAAAAVREEGAANEAYAGLRSFAAAAESGG